MNKAQILEAMGGEPVVRHLRIEAGNLAAQAFAEGFDRPQALVCYCPPQSIPKPKPQGWP